MVMCSPFPHQSYPHKLQTKTQDMEFIQAITIVWLPWVIMGAYELFKTIKEKLA
jgi:hypothetical protein